MRYNLIDLGHDALAVGLDNTSPETLNMLFTWADKILVAEKKMIDQVPAEYVSKVVQDFEIGPDNFKQYLIPLLNLIVKDRLSKIPLDNTSPAI